MIDHPYQSGGPFGRCAEPGCNRKKASHGGRDDSSIFAPGKTRVLDEPAGDPPPTTTTGPDWKPTFEASIEDAGYSESNLRKLASEAPFDPLLQSRLTPIAEGTLKVIFRKRVGIGKHGEPVTINWPAGWPLPVIGQAVMVGGDLGRVRDVTFDVDKDCIQLNCD